MNILIIINIHNVYPADNKIRKCLALILLLLILEQYLCTGVLCKKNITDFLNYLHKSI